MMIASMFLQLETMFVEADYVGICSWIQALRLRAVSFNHLDRWLPEHHVALNLALAMKKEIVWKGNTRVSDALHASPNRSQH